MSTTPQAPTLPTTASAVSQVVREMAVEQPDLAALEVSGESLTWRDLNLRADRLAGRLLEAAGGTQVRVAMQITGTRALMLAALAAVRAGMTVVPIDPTAPAGWRDEVVQDAEARVLLTDLSRAAGWTEPAGPVLDPDADSVVEDGSATPPPVELPRGPVASIGYTSGSTGRPKGVLMPTMETPAGWTRGGGGAAGGARGPLLHPAPPDRADGVTPEDEREREAHVARIFDAVEVVRAAPPRFGYVGQGTVGGAHGRLLTYLSQGGTVVAYEVRSGDVEPLGQWLAAQRVAAITMVPTMLRHMLNTMPPEMRLGDLKFLMLYGETTQAEDLTRLFELTGPDASVLITFGSTEAGAVATSLVTPATDLAPGPVPMGTPSPGAVIRIEDDEGREVAVGEVGELVVSPRRSPAGYWNRPDLTRSVFEERTGGQIYVHTGDLARRNPDGSVSHLGRRDHMVKVAGNRVELGEVETALLEEPGVSGAAVATYQSPTGATRLVGAVEPAAGAHLSPRVLRAELVRRLPASRVPDEILVLDQLPRLPNGKVDRLRLGSERAELAGRSGAGGRSGVGGRGDASDRGAARRAAAPAAPTDLASSLREIWADVLGRDDFGDEEEFFDLGGDSLQAVELFVEIERRLGLVCVPTVLLEAPTITDLAHALRVRAGKATTLIPIQVGDGARPPLYIVNAGTTGFVSRELARLLGPDQPVSEIWPSPSAVSFIGVAEACVAEVLASSPPPGYALYGFSLSGVLAFEMARQLESLGRPPGLLVLGDSRAPEGRSRAPMLRGVWRRTLDDPSPATLLRRLAGRLRGTAVHPVSDLGERGHPFHDEWTGHVALAAGYRAAGPVGCPASILRSTEYRTNSYGWRPFLRSSPVIHDIPGTHLDLITGQLEALAAHLASDLSRERPGP